MPVTYEDAALQAIGTPDALLNEQQEAKAKIDCILGSDGPFIDIQKLFAVYNILYFRRLLFPRVEVSWSARLTLCARICELVHDPNNGNKYTRIRLKLSEPLLKYRPRSDVITRFFTKPYTPTSLSRPPGVTLGETTGLDMEQAFCFWQTPSTTMAAMRSLCTTRSMMRSHPPFFGLVKRSMNRPPGKSDTWWQRHEQECGGTYTKSAEPELTKEQVERLSGLQRAGRQRIKLDGWVAGEKTMSTPTDNFVHDSLIVDEPRKKRKSSLSGTGSCSEAKADICGVPNLRKRCC